MKDNKAILIVRYENNPEIFKKCILELSQKYKVYVYDNSKVGISFEDENIYYFHDETNGGLARAINHVVEVALDDGKKLAVYFDQDSIINTEMIQKLFTSYERLKEKYSDLFVVGPQPTMPDGGDYPIKLGDNFFDNYHKASEIITSGMTFDINDIKLIGGFDEDLFLDMVDFDICWRATEQKKLVVVDKDIKMAHEVGINTIRLPFKVLPISSPIRNYYQMRNVLYCAIYKNKKSKLTIAYYILRRFVNVIINILFADKRILRLKYNLKGIKDAISKNMGKITL
jgi:rhamnosyltransferase